jgi:P27 family predicted phage terminase small subunit
MPEFLAPEAVKFWKMYAPGLEKRKLLDELSSVLFAGLCEQVAHVRELEEILRRDGVVIPGRGGRRVPHPAFSALRSAQKLCLGLLREFGMTPASRSRLGITEPEPDEDKFFRLIGGGKNTPNPKKED